MVWICENATSHCFSMQVVVGIWLYTANKSKISVIWVHLVFFLDYWSSTDASTWHCVYRIMRITILNTIVWTAKRGTWNSCCLYQLNPTFLGVCVARTPAILSHLLFSAVGFQPGVPIWQTALCCSVLTSLHAQHHFLLNAHSSKSALHTELFSYRFLLWAPRLFRSQSSSLHCCTLQTSKYCTDWAALTPGHSGCSVPGTLQSPAAHAPVTLSVWSLTSLWKC